MEKAPVSLFGGPFEKNNEKRQKDFEKKTRGTHKYGGPTMVGNGICEGSPVDFQELCEDGGDWLGKPKKSRGVKSTTFDPVLFTTDFLWISIFFFVKQTILKPSAEFYRCEKVHRMRTSPYKQELSLQKNSKSLCKSANSTPENNNNANLFSVLISFISFFLETLLIKKKKHPPVTTTTTTSWLSGAREP